MEVLKEVGKLSIFQTFPFSWEWILISQRSDCVKRVVAVS